jgi:hypothetical protein
MGEARVISHAQCDRNVHASRRTIPTARFFRSSDAIYENPFEIALKKGRKIVLSNCRFYLTGDFTMVRAGKRGSTAECLLRTRARRLEISVAFLSSGPLMLVVP